MRGYARAGLAAMALACAVTPAMAQGSGGWLIDPRTRCAVFDTGSGDAATWEGDCTDGFAEGAGTATYFKDGKQVESFTAKFAHGMVGDGHVITRWGMGSSYRGEQTNGRFNGGGILVNEKQDSFLGIWTDGKMNGFGLLERADGSRYAGEWKDSLPHGEGELRRTDGSIVAGLFRDGRLIETRPDRTDSALRPASGTVLPPLPLVAALPVKAKAEAPKAGDPFAALAGLRLKGADGSAIAFNPVEAGFEMVLTREGGAAQKTIFSFLTPQMGTLTDGSSSGGGVTGFFRLTDNGVALHYAEGRVDTLTPTATGGVALTSNGAQVSCRSWYAEGHAFSEAEKKAALADYAVRLGLPVTESEAKSGCPAARSAAAAAPVSVKPARVAAAATPAKVVKTAYAPGTLGSLTPVAVRDSRVHAVDDVLSRADAPGLTPMAQPDGSDPSRCLKVESDGLNWGFRNQCNFALQFAYCLAGDTGLAGCGSNGAPGSVAAKGFGALIADKSLSGTGADHKFRWIACAGGAGEVIARLERSDPPSGRCDRAASITAAK